MFYVKWFFIIGFWSIVAGFFHYTLPQVDIVRVVNTYEERQELTDWTRIFWSTPDSQSTNINNRDVQFIQTVRANGRPMVYRNEDTGWHWPPYFKFDTANLYTEANDAISTKENPRWFAIKHYAWRNEFFSSFPNAVSLWQVEGPEASKSIPWVNIVILTLFFGLVWGIWSRWRRFRISRIDPTLEDLQDNWEAAEDAVQDQGGRFMRWVKGLWRGRR
jgi:hypothetical protein